MHQRDLTSGEELPVPISSGEPGHGVLPHYLPDGSLVFEGHKFTGSGEYLFTVPGDGSAPSLPVGPTYSYTDRQGFDVSPDGAKVLFTTRTGQVRTIDLLTGEATPLGLSIAPESMPSWQRLPRP